MSNPMVPEKLESSSQQSSNKRRVHKRRMWKKPNTISKLPSFEFSGSDFTIDQIPVIFSGYTADDSEDSSSPSSTPMSDTESTTKNEIDQERSKSLKKRAKLLRQSTRLNKMRSMKRLEPHYLRPTSSSASKNVENTNLGVVRLKRIKSLRYNGLLKATCSSAMKGYSPNDVCTYRYCSIHGRRHSHGGDDDNVVGVPSLKRFVSMRRKFVKRQKSVNRRLTLLKRNLSRKKGSLGGGIVTDQEEGLSSENGGNDSESNERSVENVMVDVDDNEEGGMDTLVQESKPEIMDDSDRKTDKDLEKNDGSCEQNVTVIDLGNGKVEGTDNEGASLEPHEEDVKEAENVSSAKESKPETMDYDNITVDAMENEEEDVKSNEDAWNETVTLVKQAFDEILAEITDDDDVSVTKDVTLDDVGADLSDFDMLPIKERDTRLSVIVSTSHMGEESRGLKKWSYLKRVILLKRFLKSLDKREKRKRKFSDGEENETIMGLRRELVGERKNAEEWMLDHALRQVVSTLNPSQKKKVKHLVKAFESLIPMEARSNYDIVSPGREEKASLETFLRDDKDLTDLLEETQLICKEPLSLSIEALEDSSLSHHLAVEEELNDSASSSSSSQMNLRDNKDSSDLVRGKDLEETELTSGESLVESSSSHVLAVEEQFNGSALGSSIEEESLVESSSRDHLAMDEDLNGSALVSSIEEEEAEKNNLFTWRNLIKKQMVIKGNIEEEHDGNAAAVKSFQEAFEKILSEIPTATSSDHESTKSRSWNGLRKVILLKQFVKSLEKIRFSKPRHLHAGSTLEAENVLLRHRSIMERRRIDGEELMLDYAMRQALSRLAPIERQKVELLVQAFDTVLDGHIQIKNQEDQEVNKDENRIQNVFSRFQEHQKEPINLPPPTVLDGHETPNQIKNRDETVEEVTPKVDQERGVNKDEKNFKNVFARIQEHQKDLKGERIVVEKGKDSRMWKLIYKHMVTENDSSFVEPVPSVEDEVNAKRNATVTYVREALEKILSEIPDNSSDDQSIESDITTEQELFEPIAFKPKKVKGWNNVKKVVLLKRFVSDLGSLSKLSPKTPPRFLPWEIDQETEKIRLRHQESLGKKNSEEWMLDYALRQAISTLAPSQKRKVTLLAQAFDTISLQDSGGSFGSFSSRTSRTISRQSSTSSTIQDEDLKETTKHEEEEKQQCSSLWRLLCKQMEENEKNQTLPEDTKEEEKNAVELLGEVIDGISIEETKQKSETLPLKINRWSSLKKAILLKRFVKALENVKRLQPKEPRMLPLEHDVEGEKVNLRHRSKSWKRKDDEWMVDNALQEVVSKLTPARKLKVQLLVQAFESLSA